MTSCLLCKRECAQSSTLCRYHLEAKKNVESGYGRWNEAYGGVDWKDYLQKIQQSKETGEWAKEVAKMLQEQERGQGQ